MIWKGLSCVTYAVAAQILKAGLLLMYNIISIVSSMLRYENIPATEDRINSIFSIVHNEFSLISHQFI